MENPYTREFYDLQKERSLQSAREIIPLVLKLVKPKSIADIGCGTGTFLSVAMQAGVQDVLGIDGDYVDRSALLIPEKNFLAQNLAGEFRLNRKFDLVMSLEVAEHLPPEKAKAFVNGLVSLGPVILFSAAIPFQGGEHHVNEQWPEYWSRLFADEGYVAVDAVRRDIWDNHKVAFYYAQNTLFFVDEKHLADYPELEKEASRTKMLSVVHPKQYLVSRENTINSLDLNEISLRKIVTGLPRKILSVINKKIKL